MAQILIVEDSAFQRKQIQKALDGEGYEFIQARNGQQGLDMAAAERPDIIILDLNMPEMGGFEFLRTLRYEGLNMPVVVLTADIQESTRQQCLQMGVSDVINKPLRGDELLNAIQFILTSPSAGGE